jgi:NADH-quinone oxidoreductase subunit N
MYFNDPVGDGPAVTQPSMLTTTTITVAAAMTLLLGGCPARCSTY